ncbi:MAG TPA: hypothetical protein VMU78_09880, partial [Methylocella sp.]|nr:hypothetical protein [Methylocella sp.]
LQSFVIKRARILFPHAHNESRAFNIVNEKYVLTYGWINNNACSSVDGQRRRSSRGFTILLCMVTMTIAAWLVMPSARQQVGSHAIAAEVTR